MQLYSDPGSARSGVYYWGMVSNPDSVQALSPVIAFAACLVSICQTCQSPASLCPAVLGSLTVQLAQQARTSWLKLDRVCLQTQANQIVDMAMGDGNSSGSDAVRFNSDSDRSPVHAYSPIWTLSPQVVCSC